MLASIDLLNPETLHYTMLTMLTILPHIKNSICIIWNNDPFSSKDRKRGKYGVVQTS
jgi:hypothetical protein